MKFKYMYWTRLGEREEELTAEIEGTIAEVHNTIDNMNLEIFKERHNG